MPLNRFSSYETNGFFDEMFGSGDHSEPLSHYHRIASRIAKLDDDRMETKQRQAASSFLEHGITFTVYGDEEGSERIFPFDLIPRVIPLKEWQKVEQRLSQRFVAVEDRIVGLKILVLIYAARSPKQSGKRRG